MCSAFAVDGGDLLKLLWWDGDGLCLFAERWSEALHLAARRARRGGTDAGATGHMRDGIVWTPTAGQERFRLGTVMSVAGLPLALMGCPIPEAPISTSRLSRSPDRARCALMAAASIKR
jgi:hypothetical protein